MIREVEMTGRQITSTVLDLQVSVAHPIFLPIDH